MRLCVVVEATVTGERMRLCPYTERAPDAPTGNWRELPADIG